MRNGACVAMNGNFIGSDKKADLRSLKGYMQSGLMAQYKCVL